jgi:hypothetical protein
MNSGAKKLALFRAGYAYRYARIKALLQRVE